MPPDWDERGDRHGRVQRGRVLRHVGRAQLVVVARRGHHRHAALHRVVDRARHRRRVGVRADGDVDDVGPVVDGPRDAGADVGVGADPVAVEHPDREDRHLGSHADDADTVDARTDDPRDVRAVAVDVRGAPARRDDAALDRRAAEHPTGQVGVVTLHTAVDDADGDARALAARPERGEGEARQRPLLVDVGVGRQRGGRVVVVVVAAASSAWPYDGASTATTSRRWAVAERDVDGLVERRIDARRAAVVVDGDDGHRVLTGLRRLLDRVGGRCGDLRTPRERRSARLGCRRRRRRRGGRLGRRGRNRARLPRRERRGGDRGRRRGGRRAAGGDRERTHDRHRRDQPRGGLGPAQRRDAAARRPRRPRGGGGRGGRAGGRIELRRRAERRAVEGPMAASPAPHLDHVRPARPHPERGYGPRPAARHRLR